ncbi:hypothetical protein SADUNF_Sadunf17G0128500 [Salix dunnii]|uniref:Uncharacterized protein n=1 Tax=Salix dunnii TaxID=1413687 RepID=A0A835J6Z9_9ROSI|nr:hypothetical protein SADUNF_Sadunf17G0128500 [Salix dunnii]
MAGLEMLPARYGNVAFVLVAYCFLNFWMAFQRGHQNSLELMPVFFMLMMLGGIRHPCPSVVLGSIYIVTRYFYFTGYSTGDPQKRLTIGKYGFLALVGLMGCTVSFGISLHRGKNQRLLHMLLLIQNGELKKSKK